LAKDKGKQQIQKELVQVDFMSSSKGDSLTFPLTFQKRNKGGKPLKECK
jgi:hypothetical protein